MQTFDGKILDGKNFIEVLMILVRNFVGIYKTFDELRKFLALSFEARKSLEFGFANRYRTVWDCIYHVALC